ncbi:hypothetical protein OTB20_36945 [Streptomyces sp. H27-H1]|nr:hypothetical protein [Streptomyces sp. H27-H1]MCY0931675.1 hypothetical protein [Streptomyces sp. H27-H1]
MPFERLTRSSFHDLLPVSRRRWTMRASRLAVLSREYLLRLFTAARDRT